MRIAKALLAQHYEIPPPIEVEDLPPTHPDMQQPGGPAPDDEPTD
jgi:hypothetical protein